MADLSSALSGYQTGSTDTWTSAVENVTPHKAAHVNGLASAILQIEAVLGSGSTLPGSLASLAARLAVQVGADGIVLPVGMMTPFAGSSAPTGWLLCDGSAVSRTTYSALFTAIGTSYGSGDGSTTFNVPDMRGRVPVGAGTGTGGGSSGTGAPTGGDALTARSIGSWGGEEEHLITAAEAGTSQHGHTINVQSVTDTDGTSNVFRAGSSAGGSIFNATVDTHAGASASDAHNTMQPFGVFNYIIRT